MQRVIYSAEADEDVQQIVEFIARDKPVAAMQWLEQLQARCDTIASHPEAAERREVAGIPDCRSFTFGMYVVFFRRIELGVEIARVIHGSRYLGQK